MQLLRSQTMSVYDKYFIIKHTESFIIRKETPQINLKYYKAIL